MSKSNNPPKPQTINQDVIKDLAANGYTAKEIAHITGYNYSSVYYHYSNLEPIRKQASDYKTIRGVTSAVQQGKLDALNDKAIDHLLGKDLSLIKDQDIINLIKTVSTVKKDLYDQERKEQGLDNPKSGAMFQWNLIIQQSDQSLSNALSGSVLQQVGKGMHHTISSGEAGIKDNITDDFFDVQNE